MTHDPITGTPATGPVTELKHGAMGVTALAFLVVATAAPLSGTVGNGPLAILLGTGVGAPGAFVATGIILVLFAIGFSAMGREITNAGAFFAYITTGLGPRLGMAAGYVAMLSYNVLQVYVAAFVGYFGNLTFRNEFNVDVPWEVFAFGLLAVVLLLGIVGVDVNAKLLGVFLTAEMVLLLALDIAVIVNNGWSSYTPDSLNPGRVFGHGAGVALMFAALSFIGFEATAIFGEEARNPRRTVPRATYLAILVLTAIYAVSNWAVIGAFGKDKVVKVAGANPGALFYTAIDQQVGRWAFHAMNWMVLCSVFAVLLALHNMCNRYFFAFARERALPRPLGYTHARFRTPVNAGLLQAGLTALIIGAYALAGADPLLDIVPTMSGMGVVGIVGLYITCALAVVAYFRHRGDRRLWVTLISPLLAAIALIGLLVLLLDNYHLLSGRDSGLLNQLPWLVLIVAAMGFVMGSVRPVRAPVNLFRELDAAPVGGAAEHGSEVG